MGRRVPPPVTACPAADSRSCWVVVTMIVVGSPLCLSQLTRSQCGLGHRFEGVVVALALGAGVGAFFFFFFVVGVVHPGGSGFGEHRIQAGPGFGVDAARGPRWSHRGLLASDGEVAAAGPFGIGVVPVGVQHRHQLLGDFA